MSLERKEGSGQRICGWCRGGGGVGIVFKASGGFCRRDVMTELVLEDSLTVVQDRSEGTRVERRQQVGGDRNSVDER